MRRCNIAAGAAATVRPPANCCLGISHRELLILFHPILLPYSWVSADDKLSVGTYSQAACQPSSFGRLPPTSLSVRKIVFCRPSETRVVECDYLHLNVASEAIVNTVRNNIAGTQHRYSLAVQTKHLSIRGSGKYACATSYNNKSDCGS